MDYGSGLEGMDWKKCIGLDWKDVRLERIGRNGLVQNYFDDVDQRI